MRKFVTAIAAVALMPLAACDQSVEEAEGDLAEQQMESQADVVEEEADLADAMGNEAAEESLDETADALEAGADDAEEMAEGDTTVVE